MGEPRFAHQTIGDYPPGYLDFLFIRFQIGTGGLGVVPYQVSRGICPAKLPWKGFITKRLNLLEFFLPLCELVFRLEFQDEVVPFLYAYQEYKGGCLTRARNPRSFLFCIRLTASARLRAGVGTENQRLSNC